MTSKKVYIGGDRFPVENWEEMRGKVLMKLVNTERNRADLEEMPHKEWNDLSIVFYIPYLNDEGLQISVVVNNDVMKKWGVDAEEIYRAAAHNTPEERYAVRQSLRDVVNTFAEEVGCTERYVKGDPEEVDSFVCVLSNRQLTNGAVTMIYEGLMETIAEEWQSDIFILPSSVHEVLILKADVCDGPEGLVKMVRSVNGMGDSVVCEDEILSDNIYIYSRENREITMYKA